MNSFQLHISNVQFKYIHESQKWVLCKEVCMHKSLNLTPFPKFILQFCIHKDWTLGDDKGSMLTHTYPLKDLRKIEVTTCNRQADSPLYVWPDVWSGDMQV